MIVIMNPPYGHILPIKILKSAIEYSNKVISLQPYSWLEDPLYEYKSNNRLIKYKEIAEHIKNIKIIPSKKTNKLFNIQKDHLAIYEVDLFNKYNTWKSINTKTSITPKIMKYISLGHSIASKCSEISKAKTPYFIYVLSTYGGDLNGSLFIKPYKYKVKVSSTSKSNKPNAKVIFFNTESEAINFSNSIRTKFFKYLISKYKMGIQYYFGKFFPFMEDYSKPWTDERFYKFFDLNEEEIKLIESLYP